MEFHAKSTKFFRKERKGKTNNCFFGVSFILLKLGFLLIALLPNNIVFSQTYTNSLEDTATNGIWIGTQTITSEFSPLGNHFSKTDSINPYGLGVEMYFPTEKKEKNTVIKIEGLVKSETKNANALFVLIIEDGGKQVFWEGIPLQGVLIEKDRWFKFSDSVFIPANLTAKAKLKAFLWNAGEKVMVGVDDLKFSFTENKKVSYLPNLPKQNYTKSELGTHLFTNSFYSINFINEEGRLIITSTDGDIISDNILLFSEYLIEEKEKTSVNNFELKKQKTKNSKTVISLVAKNEYNKTKLDLICNKQNPKIEFTVEQKITKEVDVFRSAIIVEAAQNPTEIYRFNRQTQTNNFQKEYWLDKEGIKFGVADSSLIFYHNPEVSSLQFDTENNRLFINLDWEKDHPFLRFPLNSDSSDWKLEQSFSTYKKGDKLEYSFSANAGSKAKNLPRFMKNPSGYEATYIWTEHADFSDIRTNRATYFGSEEITVADSAIGGFVKYNIPVTKSVFYDNPDSITNFDASNGMFSSLECSIKPDDNFSSFLDEIYEKGSEICLHTPEQFTTTTGRLEEALIFMQKKFDSPTWIDHGYNNQAQNNREDLVCDGSLKESQYYSIDKWNAHNIKYFWNPYYEDYYSFKDFGFNSSIEKAYTGWGDFIPKPDYWQHKNQTENIYHWPTASALFVENDGMWNYLFNTSKFDDFINNWSVEINHCYPPWVDPKKGFWTYNSDSIIIAQPGFNKTLELMSGLHNEGKLNVCTIEDFMDYRLATESVDYEILVDGRIKITNNSDKLIQGLSFATKAKYVLVDRIKPQQKTVGNDLVFWFDIGFGESRIIRVVE